MTDIIVVQLIYVNNPFSIEKSSIALRGPSLDDIDISARFVVHTRFFVHSFNASSRSNHLILDNSAQISDSTR